MFRDSFDSGAYATPPELPTTQRTPLFRHSYPATPTTATMFDRVRGYLGVSDDEPTVGLFVDGPNVFREEFDVDLDDLRRTALQLGRVGVIRLYLDEHATPGLIQAAEARGFEVVVTSGDVDVKLAVDATALAAEGVVDLLAIGSRDIDFKPVIEYAGTIGIETVAIAPGEYGRSDALRNAADRAITLES